MYKINYAMNNGKYYVLSLDSGSMVGKELYHLKKDRSCVSYNVVNTCIMKIVDEWTRSTTKEG